MKSLSPSDLEWAMFPPDTPALAEIITTIAGDAALAPLRARDMISGLRRIAKALGRTPERTPADLRWLQPRLEKVSPASLDLSPKSWSNAVSDARAALTHVGLVKPRLNRKADLSPQWRRLWELALASKNHTLAVSLGRFVHFLDRLGVGPDEVADHHTHAFRAAVEADELRKAPELAYVAAVDGWNLAARLIPEWPRAVLTKPSKQKRVKLPLDALPVGFHGSLARLLESMLAGNGDPKRKRGRILSSQQLLDVGLRHAASGETAAPLEAAKRLRDGLMVATLALMPMRIGSFRELALGQSCVVTGTEIAFALNEDQTKTGAPWEAPDPAVLEPLMRRYLEETRPWLMAKWGESHDVLWVNDRGRLYAKTYLGQRIATVTTQLTGIRIPPHFFRDAAGTTLARHSARVEAHPSRARTFRFQDGAEALQSGHHARCGTWIRPADRADKTRGQIDARCDLCVADAARRLDLGATPARAIVQCAAAGGGGGRLRPSRASASALARRRRCCGQAFRRC